MVLRPHHVDIADPRAPVVCVTLRQRAQIQREMIADYARLHGLESMDEAVTGWIADGWAVRFAAHYQVAGL